MPLLNKEFIIVVFIALFRVSGQGTTCFAQERYEIDAANSKIAFSIKHLGVLTVDGQFDEFSATVELDKGVLLKIRSKASVESVETENDSRDETLRGKAYLDAENYPYITFDSEEITANTITGRLKIKEEERTISVPYQWQKPVDKEKIFLIAQFEIDRQDFELEFGGMDGLIGNEIKVQLKIALIAE